MELLKTWNLALVKRITSNENENRNCDQESVHQVSDNHLSTHSKEIY